MKKNEIIFNCLSIAMMAVMFIALALPVYSSTIEEVSSYSLADITFGYSIEGYLIEEGVIFMPHPFLILPFIFEIAALILIGIQFIPNIKGKQIFRIIAVTLLALAVSFIMPFAGTNITYYKDGIRQADSFMLSLYDEGYAGMIAGAAGFVAMILQLVLSNQIRKANKKTKESVN